MNNMNYGEAEILLALSRLLDYHYPWKSDELFYPDFRVVNNYIFNMANSFKDKYKDVDWTENDMLDFLNTHLLEYCKSNPFTWDLAA